MLCFIKFRTQDVQLYRIPADIKDAAFCVGVKYGRPEVWDKILGVYVNSESASDRQSAQFALACSKDPVQLSKYKNQYYLSYLIFNIIIRTWFYVLMRF